MQSRQYLADESQEDIISLYTAGNPPPVLMVLAAPGTGKSTTITRISQALLQKSENIPKFLVLTFTNKTKRDLLSKFDKIITRNEQQKKKILSKITNFHSLAWRYLRIKKPIDEQSQEQLLKDTINQLYPQSNLKKQLLKKSLFKIKHLLTEGKEDHQWQLLIQNCLNNSNQQERMLSPIIQKYRDWLVLNYIDKRVTFDYALIKLREQIAKNENKYLNNIQLLIIDEFQDSNPAQMKIVEEIILKNKHNNIKVLMFGDFDQNIYTFRGASLNYLKDFLHQYDSQTKYLENSYRLNNSVKNLSQKLITMNPQYKQLRSEFYQGYELKARNQSNNNDTEVRKFYSEISQVRWVVDKLYEHIGNGIQMGDITILFRGFKNSLFYQKLKLQLQRRVVQGQRQIYYDTKVTYDIFKRRSIKYTMAIFQYFYMKRERKILHNYISKICLEIEYIGKKDKILQKFLKENEIKRNSMHYPTQGHAKKLIKWNEFMHDFERFKIIINQTENNSFEQAFAKVYNILKEATWMPDNELKSSYRDDNLNEFVTSIQDVVRLTNPLNPVYDILQQLMNNKTQDQAQLQLRKDLKSFKKSNRVQIQTIHGAKGLQFKVVFLCGLNFEYIQQNYRQEMSLVNVNQRIEQRQRQFLNDVEKANQQLRLIYTAITRTSSFSYVSSSEYDNFRIPSYFGQIHQHSQFVYLKNQAPIYEYVHYSQTLDNPTYQYLLQNKAITQRRLIPRNLPNNAQLFFNVERLTNEQQAIIKVQQEQIDRIKVQEEQRIKRQQNQQ